MKGHLIYIWLNVVETSPKWVSATAEMAACESILGNGHKIAIMIHTNDCHLDLKHQYIQES